jgi:uncharacterized protein
MWMWDKNKDRSNKLKHGLSFSTAQLVFDDPLALSRLDSYADEERWQTVGLVGSVVIFVVHTFLTSTGDGVSGRIVSARKATAHERRAYEEGEF